MPNADDILPYRHDLRKWAGKHVKGTDNREELAQMTAIRAIELLNAGKYEESGKFDRWLRGIMRIEFLQGRRKNAFLDNYVAEIEEGLERPQYWTPIPQIEYVFLKEVLAKIDKLDTRFKLVLFRVADGSEINEIADLLNLSRNDAAELIHRARRKLEQEGCSYE